MLNCAVVIFVNLFLTTVFYDEFVMNKGQIKAADYIDQKQFNNYHIYSLKTENNIFQFYCNRPVDFLPIGQFNNFKPTDSAVFYANQPSIDTLTKHKANFKVIKAFIDYPQESLVPEFLRREYKI